MLGCGINRAYDIVKQKSFPKIKIGNRFYIPKEGFDKWVETYTYKEFRIQLLQQVKNKVVYKVVYN